MNDQKREKLIRFIDRMTPEQEARLERLVEDDALFLFLAWLQATRTVGRGLGFLGLVARKSIMALVWILTPIVVMKWLLSGEVTLQEIFKWFTK